MQIGNPGEFTVWVDGRKVADKDGGDFPPESQIVGAVRAAMPAKS